MKFIRVLKADQSENLNKKYRIEVYYDDGDFLWDDISNQLTSNNITIYSNLRDYKLAENEERYDGDPDELREQGYDLRPIYAYIHSGIALSLSRGGQFSDQFDSGLAGVAAVEGKFTPEQEKVLENYINDYNEISSGQVYGFRILDNDDDSVEDGVGGFIGYGDKLADAMLGYIDPKYGITKEDIEKALDNPKIS